MLDVDQLTTLLERGMRDTTQLRDGELAAVLHALSHPALRDAAIAVMTGHPEDTAQLARSLAPGTTWFTSGPLNGDEIRRALPLLHRLADAATTQRAASAVASILAYLDWASGRPLRAATRLSAVNSDGLAPLLRRMIAAGVRGPRITSTVSGPRR